MKRLILYITFITMLSGAFALPAIAAAQTTTATPETSESLTTTLAGWATGVTPTLKIIDGLYELFVLPVAGLVFNVSGYMLDWSIDYSLNFATQVSNAGSSIVLGWTIVRDIFNMFFIFALIYISITTMLGTTGFLGKVTLRNIIIAALLINFSFFFTEVIIDAGNIMGGWVYSGIETTLSNANATSSFTPTGVSISAGLSGALGVFSLYNDSAAGGFLQSFTLNGATQQLISATIRLALIVFATYIFAYVAVLFLARTVELLFLLVMSPIGLAGWILPMTKKMSEEWKEEMEKNVLLAPTFLLYLYIIIAFVSSPLFSAPNTAASATNAFNPTQYFKYFLLAAMLLYALKKAKSLSGILGDMVSGIAKQLGQALAGVAMGGAGLVGQLTVGAAASRIAGSKGVNQIVAGGGITGALAGVAQKKIQGVGDYHFNIPGAVFGKEMDGYKPGKGYTSLVKDSTERQKKAQESLEATPKEKAPVKNELEKAEREAYKSHRTYGDRYDQAYAEMERAERIYKTDPNKTNTKAFTDAQKYVENIKTLIEKDPTFDKNKIILEKQEQQLEQIKSALQTANASGDRTEADRLKKQVDAMNIAMAQGRAIRQAQKGPGISLAKAARGESSSKLANELGRILGGATLGLTNLAAGQILKDNEKIVKGLREVTEGKGGKKGKEKELTKLIADLAGEEAEGNGPTSPNTPTTPPPAPTRP